MTQEQKNAERAEKAAKKLSDAADKLAKKNADKAAKVTKVTEPAADPLKSEVKSEVKAKPVVVLGYKTNKPSSKTTDCLHQIIKSADVCLNTNTEANIQDQICFIIRQSLRAYELHVGVPFDTEIG